MLIPKGRMFQGITELLREAGYDLTKDESSYRPEVNVPGLKVKILKAQNIGKLIEEGSYDIGITGYDWLAETNSCVTELLDLGMYKGKVAVAAPKGSRINLSKCNGDSIVLATEFENLSKKLLESFGITYAIIRTYGATEAFPPEDSDIIVDNVFTGKTIQKNGLKVINTVLETSARLVANPQSLNDAVKKPKIDQIATKIRKVIERGFDENCY